MGGGGWTEVPLMLDGAGPGNVLHFWCGLQVAETAVCVCPVDNHALHTAFTCTAREAVPFPLGLVLRQWPAQLLVELSQHAGMGHGYLQVVARLARLVCTALPLCVPAGACLNSLGLTSTFLAAYFRCPTPCAGQRGHNGGI